MSQLFCLLIGTDPYLETRNSARTRKEVSYEFIDRKNRS